MACPCQKISKNVLWLENGVAIWWWYVAIIESALGPERQLGCDARRSKGRLKQQSFYL